MNYTYAQWLKDTKGGFGLTSGRSKELQAVDEYFKSYEGAKDSIVRKINLQKALEAWKLTFGPGDAWKKSARNNNRAVEQLDAMLGGGSEESAFNMGRPIDFMHESLVHSRMGVLYLFSNLSVQPGLFSLLLEGGIDLTGQGLDIGEASDLAKNIASGAKTANDKLGLGKQVDKLEKNIFTQPRKVQIATVLNQPQTLKQKFTQAILDLRDRLVTYLKGFVDGIKAKLRDKFGIIQDIGGYIPKVINFIVNQVCAAAAPLVGSSIKLAQSTASLCLKVQDKFQTWMDGRHVEVNQGHPATVVDSIRRAQTMALLGGIYAVISDAGGVAIDATAWGSGAIYNMIKSGLELLIKFLWRLGEAVRFNEFCAQAREFYDAAKGVIGASNDGKAVGGTLPTTPFKFAQWYRSYALNLPLIAVLTLNSGICGDKMSYLSMFNQDGILVTAEQFQAGARFLDNLKPWGAEYLENSGFTITATGDILVTSICDTVAIGKLGELASKGTEADRQLGLGGGPKPMQITSMGFSNSRDAGKSSLRMGAERLFKGFAKG